MPSESVTDASMVWVPTDSTVEKELPEPIAPSMLDVQVWAPATRFKRRCRWAPTPLPRASPDSGSLSGSESIQVTVDPGGGGTTDVEFTSLAAQDGRILESSEDSGVGGIRPKLLVTYTDGGGGNTAPMVSITAPPDGSSFPEGTSIGFTGTANDAEDGELSASLGWSSSIDGNDRLPLRSPSSASVAVPMKSMDDPPGKNAPSCGASMLTDGAIPSTGSYEHVAVQFSVPASIPSHSRSAVQPAPNAADRQILSALSSPAAKTLQRSAKYVSAEEHTDNGAPALNPSQEGSAHKQPLSPHSNEVVMSS